MPKPPGSITPVSARRLSSLKNLRVPSTLCSKLGEGSSAKSAVMVAVSPAMPPLGLPAASRSSVPRGGTSESAAILSALNAGGVMSTQP